MYYLNTEGPIVNYRETRNHVFYVDKSLLIEKIIEKIDTGEKYICITRPRRFGKTVNANMLVSYFSKGYDTRYIFDDLKIATCSVYKKHMNQHHVFHIDLSRLPDPCETYEQYISWINRCIRLDIQENYDIEVSDDESTTALLSKTKDKFIFILDEYDSVFFKSFMQDRDKQEYLDFLKSMFIGQSYVDLVYMTGVVPFVNNFQHCEINTLHEIQRVFNHYTIMHDHVFDEYFGILEDEVKGICRKQSKLHYEELASKYKGYSTYAGKVLFNPRSVVSALHRGICLDFWTETGPVYEIANCIERNVNDVKQDIIKMIAGIPVVIELEGYSVLVSRTDTRNAVLSEMVIYGFLSYHNGRLTIPNRELMTKFYNVLRRESMGEIAQIVKQSKELFDATISKEEEKVAQILENMHYQCISILDDIGDNYLKIVVTLAYLYAYEIYKVERIEHIEEGYCDYLFFPKYKRNPAIILEVTCRKSVEEAIQQVKTKNYIECMKDAHTLILCGIQCDSEKNYHCKIEILYPNV